MAGTDEKELRIYISTAELALLKKLDFPCSEKVLASATPTEDGIELTGSKLDFDSLVGWVAGEANDADRRRATRKAALLSHIFEELEAALSPAFFAGRARW